jgi:hypothetical protein
MYCPSCGNDIAVELKYCNRCGANLSVPVAGSAQTVIAPPAKLTLPSIVMGLTIVCGLGIIFASASQFAMVGIHPFAIVWMVLFGAATLFGCTALMIRFWTKLLTLQRETIQVPPARPSLVERQPVQQFPPRLEPVPSVTENTTRTFTPIYREPSDR